MKSIRLTYILVSLALGSLVTGCENKAGEENHPEIATTNSYLQCVVKDLCQDKEDVLCLTPPGMCPGHFDISPGQVQQLCDCKLLLLFDFQKKVEESLSRVKQNGLQTAIVKTPPGLCVPEAYLAVCRQVYDVLLRQYPENEPQLKHRMELIENRLENLADELAAEMQRSGLKSAKVLASNRQEQFCNWLGLQTIATFVGSDSETVSNINNCLKQAQEQDIRFVVANKQQGTQLAEALAERLKVKAVVFSNFPPADNRRDAFDKLVRANVQALFGAAEL
jgi:zinc transport system substrate-binding protein